MTINIYNVAGELVKTFNFGRKPTGYYLTKDKEKTYAELDSYINGVPGF